MATPSITLRPPMTRDEVGTLVAQTMGYVAGTTAAFAVGSYLGRDVSNGGSFVLLLVSFGVLFGIRAAAEKSTSLAVALLYGFGLLLGLSLAPTLAYYAEMNPEVLWQTGAATALFVAGFGAVGYATRRDLTAVARYATWALIGLILFGIVLIFVQIPGGSVVYALAGLAIFAGLTAFDFQRLRRNQDIREAPLLAVSIFLDLLNVFLLFLGLFSND
jgi:FtsH-binding integral membrane protein